MLVKVVGIENAEFEVDNQTIKGQKLFYEYEHQKVEGRGTGTVFEKNGTREVGEEIEVKWSKMYKKFYVVKPKKEEKEA